MNFYFVDYQLTKAFYKLGAFIARYPGYFIIVPLLLSALCITGFQNLRHVSDPEYLFSPTNGPAKTERKIIEKYFPTSYVNFSPQRLTRTGKLCRLMITAKDNGTLLRPDVFSEIVELERFITKSLTVEWTMKSHFDGSTEKILFSYQDLCAKSDGKNCIPNDIVDLLAPHIDLIVNGSLQLTYPLWIDLSTFRKVVFPFVAGGVELKRIYSTSTISNESSYYEVVENIKAINVNYFLRADSNSDYEDISTKFESAFLSAMESTTLHFINISYFTSVTLDMELEKNTNAVVPIFVLNIGLMVMFCVLTSMMTDWVKSKPLLACLGIISAVLATATAFGLLMYLNVEFIGVSLAIPFLMLGIGIDDTFVLMAAWRRTDSPLHTKNFGRRSSDNEIPPPFSNEESSSVPSSFSSSSDSVTSTVAERLAKTYSDAAVSITITSLTDMLSFWIGILTPFPSVQIFCIYCATSVIFTYVWHITFFGSCLALSGYAELTNRHSVICVPVKPRSVAQKEKKSFFYTVFCSGGRSEEDPFNVLDNQQNQIMVFFRDVMGGILNRRVVKGVILAVFTVFWAFSIYGITQIEEGLERRNLARYDSYSIDFYDTEDKYFREYPYRLSVVIGHNSLNYSDLDTQTKIENLMKKFESLRFVDPQYSESWLRDFTSYLNRSSSFSPLDVTTEDKFVKQLRENYLGFPNPTNSLASDISFRSVTTKDEDAGVERFSHRIEASRFFIQGHNIMSSVDERYFVEEVRAICDAHPHLNVSVFHPYFIYFDQFLIVKSTTIQCVVIAALVMMFVSLIFIPNALCSLWVALSIVSIEVGVLGFMSFLHIKLDSISMINLIMCIGFSVDFSAHVSYHFVSRVNMSSDERVTDSMFALGLPILQGALSTILGVIGLSFVPSYIFKTFFNIVVLIIALGFFHAIFLLPVLLSLFTTSSSSSCDTNTENKKVPFDEKVHQEVNKLEKRKSSGGGKGRWQSRSSPYSCGVNNCSNWSGGAVAGVKGKRTEQWLEEAARRSSYPYHSDRQRCTHGNMTWFTTSFDSYELGMNQRPPRPHFIPRLCPPYRPPSMESRGLSVGSTNDLVSHASNSSIKVSSKVCDQKANGSQQPQLVTSSSWSQRKQSSSGDEGCGGSIATTRGDSLPSSSNKSSYSNRGGYHQPGKSFHIVS